MIIKFSDYIAYIRINTLLKESKLSQKNFAKEAGISASVMSEATSGHHILSPNNAKKVALKFNVSPDWLMGGICNREGNMVENVGIISDLLCETDSEKVKIIFNYLSDENGDVFDLDSPSSLLKKLEGIQLQIDELKKQIK